MLLFHVCYILYSSACTYCTLVSISEDLVSTFIAFLVFLLMQMETKLIDLLH